MRSTENVMQEVLVYVPPLTVCNAMPTDTVDACSNNVQAFAPACPSFSTGCDCVLPPSFRVTDQVHYETTVSTPVLSLDDIDGVNNDSVSALTASRHFAEVKNDCVPSLDGVNNVVLPLSSACALSLDGVANVGKQDEHNVTALTSTCLRLTTGCENANEMFGHANKELEIDLPEMLFANVNECCDELCQETVLGEQRFSAETVPKVMSAKCGNDGIHLSGRVEGVNVSFLVDTGADPTVITWTLSTSYPNVSELFSAIVLLVYTTLTAAIYEPKDLLCAK